MIRGKQMQKIKCGISIDMDFFCRELPAWDWGHTEDKAFMNDVIWATRTMGGFDVKGQTDPKKYADFIPLLLPSVLEKMGFVFTKKTRIGVAWSHKFAFDFFKDMQANLIFNFDAHHDCGYPGGGHNFEIDCSNWGLHLNKSYAKTLVTVYPKWKYATDEPASKYKCSRIHFESMVKQDFEIEGIFIAQSPSWVPPYFDEYMKQVVNLLKRKCGKYVVENGEIIKRRDLTVSKI